MAPLPGFPLMFPSSSPGDHSPLLARAANAPDIALAWPLHWCALFAFLRGQASVPGPDPPACVTVDLSAPQRTG